MMKITYLHVFRENLHVYDHLLEDFPLTFSVDSDKSV